MRILLTGAASHLAQALLPRLMAHPEVESVTGIDLRPAAYAHPRFRFIPGDLLAMDLRPMLDDQDVVLHLAFVVLAQSLGSARKDRALMRRVNVDGTRRLCQAMTAMHRPKLVYTSSVAVYGAWPDNPPLIREDWFRRPMPGFAYGEDKAAVEDDLDSLQRRMPAFRVTRLRIHAIVGRQAQPLLNLIARTRIYPRLPDPQPPIQCVFEEDAVQALLAALVHEPGGIFNIAAPDPLPLRDLVRQSGRLALGLPHGLLEKGHRLLWPLTGALGDPGWLAGLRHPLAVDIRHAQDVLDWRPRFTVADCIAKVRQF